MVDRRELTGTKTLQIAWSALFLFALAGVLLVRPAAVDAVAIVAGGAAWLAGLLVLGWHERRAWNRLVAGSTFERQSTGSMADLQRVVKGRGVTVATDVPGPLSQTHVVLATAVQGVEADVRIELEHVRRGGGDDGVETGNAALDAAWVMAGSPNNVELLLSTEVQAALMDLSVPATVRVTAERVALRVPFTRLTPEELRTGAVTVATVAERLERLGRAKPSPRE